MGRRFFSRLSFGGKINLGIAAIILVFGLFTALLVSGLVTRSLLDESKKRGSNMVLNLAGRAEEYLLVRDYLQLKTTVDQYKALGAPVEYAFIQDQDGSVLAHTFLDGFPMALKDVNSGPAGDDARILLLDTSQTRIYDFAADVRVGESRIGTARIGLSWLDVQQTSRRLLLAIFAVTGAGALLSLLLGSLFARTVTRRINLLRASAEAIMAGDLDVQVGNAMSSNCWDIMDCGEDRCPAYGDTRRCWYVAGTLCPICAGINGNKQESCKSCPVYRQNVGDEIQSLAEAFDVMAATLKEHIGELEEARRSLARQEQLLRTVFDVTPDLVSMQDTQFVYRLVNKAFRRYFSLSEAEVVGRTDKDIFPSGQAVLNTEEDRQILETGLPMSKEIYVQRGENRRWFHVVKVPVYDGEAPGSPGSPDSLNSPARPARPARIVGLLLTARDISVIKRYQEQLIQSQKMEDLGKLAGGVAHEINTPLGIILGYAQILLEDLPTSSQARKDVAVIEKQAQVCRKIVADLLGFSRQQESSWAEVDLNESIRETLAVVRQIFQQERVFVETQLDESVPPIRGDKEKLKQVWFNLLSNAFDAIGKDGGIVLRTKLCKHRRRVVVSVADTGKGISLEHMAQVFDPFFTTKPVGAGTGLGLAVSFGIIKDHKGKISAVSPAPVEYLGAGREDGKPPGPGTVFFIELPLTEEGLPEDECMDI